MVMDDRYPAEHGTGGLWSTIRRNSVPAALAAIGLGLLWSNRATGSQRSQRTRDARYGHDQDPQRSDWRSESSHVGSSEQGQPIGEQVVGRAQQVGEQVVGQAQHVAGQAHEVAGQVVGQVQQSAGQMQGQVQERAGQAQQQAQGVWQTLEANPVAMGGLGVVLGGVAGLLLPKTQTENQLLGESREKVLGSVQEMAGETVAAAQRVAEQVGKSAMEAGEAALDDLNTEQSTTGKSTTGKSSTGKRSAGKRGKGKHGGGSET